MRQHKDLRTIGPLRGDRPASPGFAHAGQRLRAMTICFHPGSSASTRAHLLEPQRGYMENSQSVRLSGTLTGTRITTFFPRIVSS